MLDFFRPLPAAILLLTLCLTSGRTDAQPPGGPAPVRVSKVEMREGAVGLPFVGTTRPRRRSVVGSAVDGRVHAVNKDEGDFVKFGEVMVELRTKTIEIEVRAARAEETLRNEELKELKAGSRPEEVRAAKARLDAASALHDYNVARFERVSSLFKRNAAATQEELDEALSAKLTSEFAKLAAKATYELTQAGPRIEKIAQAEARLLVQQEEVARLEDRKNKYAIKAPFAGYVVSKHSEVGDWVKSGDVVLEVMELDPIEIEVNVPERLVAQLRRGMEVTVQFPALPQVSVGTIFRVVPQADNRSRSFPVRIRMDNPNGKDASPPVKAGMLAQVQLPVGQSRPALFVHGDALVLNGTNKSVYMVQQGEQGLTVVPVPVDVGITDGAYREVRDARGILRPGVQVVVEGNERLRPGQAIKILE